MLKTGLLAMGQWWKVNDIYYPLILPSLPLSLCLLSSYLVPGTALRKGHAQIQKAKRGKKNHCLHFHSFGSVFFLELPSLSWWSGHKAQYMVVNHQTAGREEGYLVIHREQTSHLILNVCPDLANFSQSKTLYQRGAYHDSHVWILISSKNISTSKTGSEQI